MTDASLLNPPVNRCLKDTALDHIDHALGRPTWPLRESYRNYFATESDGVEARAFEASSCWHRGAKSGRLTFYHVTDYGRQALAEHLASIGADRVYNVSFGGHERPVSAPTAAKARYSRFLQINDVMPDLTLIDFSRQARVRLA